LKRNNKHIKAVVEQNYFQFDQQYYKQTEGLSVGAPTYAILAEVYIQHMGHKQLYSILMNYQIIGYFRYIDDILIIYNQNKRNIDETSAEFSKQRTNIRFTTEKEQHNSINFLIVVAWQAQQFPESQWTG
jgi:hypothetical protein